MARTHHFFDWLDRFEDSTEIPATGPLPLGEIAVQELASGHFPKFRRYIEREVGGCGESACEVPKTRKGRDA